MPAMENLSCSLAASRAVSASPASARNNAVDDTPTGTELDVPPNLFVAVGTPNSLIADAVPDLLIAVKASSRPDVRVVGRAVNVLSKTGCTLFAGAPCTGGATDTDRTGIPISTVVV